MIAHRCTRFLAAAQAATIILAALPVRAQDNAPVDVAQFDRPVKLACVGDSITQGVGTKRGQSWPDQVHPNTDGATLIAQAVFEVLTGKGAATPDAGAPAVTVADLQTDGMTGPLDATPQPRLTWRLESAGRGVTTASWQVLVASDADLLAKDTGDLWDSGQVGAQRVPGALYEGKALTAGARCHWKVRCWTSGNEPSAWSEPAVFEVAPTAADDWRGAQWMDDGKENPKDDAEFYEPDPAPLMRREFTLSKPVVRARLHVAGLGLCYPSINGERFGNHVFDPPWTRFDKRILFRTHDVTARLSEGANCLGLALGNGWYNPLPMRMWGRRNLREALPVGRPRALACLVVEHPDGMTTTVTSGDGWKTAGGRTIRNSIYLGEVRDAREDPTGWDRPGFNDGGWTPVEITDAPLEPLQPLHMPPVRLQEPVQATTVTSPAPGTWIVDFGQNMTAIPEIRLEAPAGTQITFRFGELLHEDGTLNPMTSVCGQIKGTRKLKDGTEQSVGGPGAPAIAWQQDVYIARGGGPEVFRPDFTFHAFRYMEVRGVPKAPRASDIRAFPFHTDLASAGSFACSNKRLNDVQEMCRRTFLANAVTVQSDCPHRERFGYGGDIVATSGAYLMNFDAAAFYEKTVRDWADSVLPDGRLTDTAPFVGVDYCGVGWAMVHPLLLEQLYQYHGNRELIEEQFPVAARWLGVVAAQRKDGLVTSGLGDHEALVRARGPELSTPMFIDTARRMARLARIIGKDTEAATFEGWAEESTAAWAKEFLDASSGVVAAGGQPQQTFALGFGAASDDARQAVFDHLVADLTAPDDAPRLTTGIYGTHILLEQLSQHGRTDLAYALSDRRTFPSWIWMLQNGATTLWEHWAGSDGTYSHNHPMFGSVSEWFFRWLGGIQCAGDAVAFDRIHIRPQLVEGLEWVRCAHQSPRGTIASNWKHEGGQRHFEIIIPPDTRAEVELPGLRGAHPTEGGKELDQRPEIKVVGRRDSLRMELGSGRYHFTLTPNE